MKSIPGLPGYSATEAGQIIGPSGKTLKPRLHKGYLQIATGPIDNRTTRMVNRLVALAFLGEPPDGLYHAAHRNGDSTDNRVDNLYWATPKQNGQDKVNQGRAARGSKNGWAVLTEKEVAIIRQWHEKGATQKELAEEFEVSMTTIFNITHNKSWVLA